MQEASIIGHLRRVADLEGGATTTAVELGAGGARLSDRLNRVTEGRLAHVLVDRQEPDSKSRDATMLKRGAWLTRVVADVADFDFDGAGESDQCQLCMSKHLCGPATDLAIAAIGRAATAGARPPSCLATCCHYLCRWCCFEGREWWTAAGLSEQDFETSVSISQWNSMRKLAPREGGKPKEEAGREQGEEWLPDLRGVAAHAAAQLAAAGAPPLAEFAAAGGEFERTFARSEKAALGRRVKELLDLARAERLQRLGYRVRLLRYTTRSLEDRLLVASPLD